MTVKITLAEEMLLTADTLLQLPTTNSTAEENSTNLWYA